MFDNEIILIIGGTGSFGEAVVIKSIENNYFKEIRILSRDEKKQDDMRKKFNFDKLKFFIGDVRDYDSIENAFDGVDYVFHAAALKQVPSCEFFPMEAVKTNIIGSNNVIDACINYNVSRAVFLSTDKACYPINAMGMSKALMEKNVIARSRSIGKGGPILCCTRYGNVIGTRGSVIPFFLEKIRDGSPITITNKKMIRFMMTLDQACELVFYSLNKGNQGSLFIQKSPASTIGDIVSSLERLCDRKNLETKIIGIRHGEKLYEALATSEEISKAIDHEKYYEIPADSRNLNYDKYFIEGKENITEESYNSNNTNRLSEKELDNLIMKDKNIKEQINEIKRNKKY
ncbi:MAG: polysaccharide biosynthesis protein [Mycoplasmoidaceae bacterium]